MPPPRLRESNFKLRQRRQERMQPQQGLEFWDRWLHEARTILDQGAMWFGASPPGPPGLPSFVPVQEGEQGIRLKWSPPLPKIEAPVEGYVLQVKDVSAQPSDSALASTFAVDVWHDALSLLFCKDEPTCTWSTHTEWQLGLRKEDGSNEEVLLPGRKYTFRVLAVNRMGASKPSEELAQAIELSSTPSSSSRKLKTTRPETRDRLSTLLPLELWHFSLLFSQVKAKVAGDEGVIKQFGSLCDSHGLFAHSNKLGFAYLWGLLTGRYRPWENFGVDVDARCPEAGGSSLGVLHGVVAWIGVPSDVSEETIARALEGKDRKLLELTLVDTQASVELKTWRGRFRTKSEAEAAVVEQPQLACITSSSTGLPQKMPKLVHGHRLEQLRGMGHDFSEPDFNSVPKHEWFDEPLMEAFETPERWTSSIPRENLTAVKLIVQGLLISMTGGGKAGSASCPWRPLRAADSSHLRPSAATGGAPQIEAAASLPNGSKPHASREQCTRSADRPWAGILLLQARVPGVPRLTMRPGFPEELANARRERRRRAHLEQVAREPRGCSAERERQCHAAAGRSALSASDSV